MFNPVYSRSRILTFSHKPLLFLPAVLALFVGLACQAVNPSSWGAGEDTEGADCLQEGCVAPNFTLQTYDGTVYELHQLQGHPVVVNFWATWCGYCVKEMPDIQELHDTYSQKGLYVLGVNCSEDTDDVLSFANNHNLSFPILLDESGQVSNLYRINSIPTTYFLDIDSVIRKVNVGSISYTKMQENVEDYLHLTLEPTQSSSRQPTSIPATSPAASKLLKGCVTSTALNTRLGPGKQYEMSGGLHEGDCRTFDARNTDGSWVRLSSDYVNKKGQRLWASVRFLRFEGDVMGLGVAP